MRSAPAYCKQVVRYHPDRPTLIAFTLVVVLTAAVTARVIITTGQGIAAPIEARSAR